LGLTDLNHQSTFRFILFRYGCETLKLRRRLRLMSRLTSRSTPSLRLRCSDRSTSEPSSTHTSFHRIPVYIAAYEQGRKKKSDILRVSSPSFLEAATRSFPLSFLTTLIPSLNVSRVFIYIYTACLFLSPSSF
jgi:hypothetical protein